MWDYGGIHIQITTVSECLDLYLLYLSLAGLEASELYLKVSLEILECCLVTEVSLVTVGKLGQVQLLNTETNEQEGFNWSFSEVQVRVPERNESKRS